MSRNLVAAARLHALNLSLVKKSERLYALVDARAGRPVRIPAVTINGVDMPPHDVRLGSLAYVRSVLRCFDEYGVSPEIVAD